MASRVRGTKPSTLPPLPLVMLEANRGLRLSPRYFGRGRLVVSSEARLDRWDLFHQASEIVSDYRMGVLEQSGKLVVLMEIIEESLKNGDKILVFR